MKLVKSLLLGSAAALVAGTAAQAADLPTKKAAPVEYVRVCDWTGAGYFYIPGTDTCLKIGGFVRAEFEYQSGASFFTPSTSSTAAQARAGNGGVFTSGRNVDQTGFFVRGRLEADARTQTAYGTVRTFVRYQLDKYSGAENEYSGFPGGNGNGAYIDKAFVQFAGITAGRVQSFFDFGADPYGFDGVSTSDSSTQAFAYTANFAGGFSATVAIEDPNVRRFGINGTATAGGVVTSASYEGDRIPDVVGQLRVDQAWGAAQLSAAYHQVNTTSAGAATKDEDGFAFRGGLQIKLPMLAAGDEIQIEGGYSEGAYSYINSNNFQGGYGSAHENGGYAHANVDAIAIGNGAGYTLALEKGYSINAGLLHYFTPTVNNIIFGSYEHVEYGQAGNIAWYAGGEGPAESYRIADQINWFPVKDLEIGLEVMYINTTQKVPGSTAAVGNYAAVALPAAAKRDNDSFSGRLRIERDF